MSSPTDDILPSIHDLRPDDLEEVKYLCHII